MQRGNTKSINEAGSFEIKPVLMITVDGGPDENPRHQKVIQVLFIKMTVFFRKFEI